MPYSSFNQKSVFVRRSWADTRPFSINTMLNSAQPHHLPPVRECINIKYSQVLPRGVIWDVDHEYRAHFVP
ncbi:hypothetical protein Y032_0037g3431 [Ancylostoma ceylanicum]|uniref:Uncharacterized protein n=1 Tax=Ancylostoma ceylanicum TaxID=53326 RepID=A0A016UL77_9BILA|nr:hypothetical protein Y032_0037g3431 [Ancylostoma ceylanicum]